jgi:hypothetical protein
MKREAPVAGQTMSIQHAGQGESGECEAASAFAWLTVDFGTGDDNPGCK